MPGFSSLNIANSGLRAAQANLATTAHNIANAEISGYSRQRIVQKEFPPRRIGVNARGDAMQVGLGVDRHAVEQIRSNFFDKEFRVTNSRLNFYSIKASVGAQIETILGELDGAYRMQTSLQDLWRSLQNLNTAPDSVDTREFFISTAVVFMDKAHHVFDELFQEQIDLDMRIRETVHEINELVAGIDQLNRVIEREELVGDNANDLRDERNRLLDSLSSLIPITQTVDPRTGWINVNTINNFLLSNGVRNTLGFRQVAPDYPFVEPVFTSSATVLPPDTPTSQFVPLIDYRHAMQTGMGRFAQGINALAGNDSGTLFALIASRGAIPATYRGLDALFRPVLPDARPIPWPSMDDINAQLDIWAEDQSAFNFALFVEALTDYRNEWIDRTAGYTEPPGPMWNYPESTDWLPPNPDAVMLDEDGAPILDENGDPIPVFDLTTMEGQQALMRAYHEYRLHRENDMRNFHRLYPLSERDPAQFAIDAIPGSPGFDDLMRIYDAAEFNYYHAAWSKEFATIPRVQMHLDTIVNSVVRMLNNAVAPIGADGHWDFENAPVDLFNNPSFTPVFVRGIRSHPQGETMPRFDPVTGLHNPGLQGDATTMYTTRNIMVNPELLKDGGWNLLALSYSSQRGDTTLMEDILSSWQSNTGPYAIEIPRGSGYHFNIQDAYNNFITNLSIDTREANNTLNTQFLQTTQADNRRQSIMSVSMDEEMSSMMTFQFAYQAAARLFNIVDSMIDTIVNRMGRVGA